jgi:3-carboxy-cis,cis-muconate cycloisomerase
MSFSALDSALTGPLFATEAMRAVFADEARLSAMLQVEAALARAQAERGLAPEGLAPAIEAITPGSLDLAALGAATARAGVPTIPFVKAVQARLPADLEPHLHKGATTQDVLDTALVLQIRTALDLIAGDLAVILENLSRLADAHRATICVGRTYGQHAAPITFGYKAAVWLAGISDAAGELPALRQRVLVASLGGPVGQLTALGDEGPAVLDGFARALGLGAPPIAWHVSRGGMAALGAWLARLVGALAKIATDVAHLASTELGEAAEPHVPGRGGSSAMPHKRNPVSSTVILAAHAAAKGHAATLLDAMAGQHERPAGLWHAEWHSLPQLFGLASGALRETLTLSGGLVVDAARMRDNLDATRGLLFADAVAARLAPHLGGEAAHIVVEHAAARVRETGRTLAREIAEAPEVAALGGAADLDAAFDLAPAIRAAGPWIDRARAQAARVQASLRSGGDPCL